MLRMRGRISTLPSRFQLLRARNAAFRRQQVVPASCCRLKAAFRAWFRDMPRSRSLLTATFLAAIVVFITSCSRQKESASDSPVPASAEAPAPGPASAPSAASTAQTAKTFLPLDTALKSKEYDKAVAAFLAIRKQPLTEQQAEAMHGELLRLQHDLAAGVAAGDLKAKAAADMLRESAMHR